MWFRLASLWGCTVVEAQAKIDSYEFSEWIAFYRIEPWGCEAFDIRNAMLHYLLSCAHAAKGHSPTVNGSMPPWARDGDGRQTPEMMQQTISGWLGRT